LDFSHDPTARSEKSEFLLGENILMAPVFTANQNNDDTRDVYLPGPASWISLWHGTLYVVTSDGLLLQDVQCPIG
jgi:alpha-glucosidase (family GH31 glycosyl hydrolase)